MTASTSIDVHRLHQARQSGQLSRHGLLEEIERHLDRSPDQPIGGALEVLLEELHKSPADPLVLRLLARLYERNGDEEGAKRALRTAERAGDADADASSDQLKSDDLLDDAAAVQDWLTVARVLTEVGLIDVAQVTAQRAVTLEPRSLSALNLLAKIRHIQGRLSEMIDLWRQVQLLSPNPEGALAHLGLVQLIAEDDDLAGMPFAEIGKDIYAPKHPAQVEIERAFAKFRERDFQGATATTDALASANRQNEPGVYKLAVLQKAWILERTGDLAGARQTLQALGRERGFETDLDRLSLLGRICQRIGTDEALDAAQHIYEHQHVQHGKLSALPRLVALYSARGDQERAQRYQREFERRFKRRMQKPSPAETLRTLALKYIPLLYISPFAELEPRDRAAVDLEQRLARTDAGLSRRQALSAYLTDRRDEALQRFADLTGTGAHAYRDWAYLGDLREGDAQCYARALEQGGHTDTLLLLRVLQLEPADVTQAISALDADQRQAACAQLLRYARLAPGDPRRWQQLARLEQSAGRPAADQHWDKGLEIAAALVEDPPHIGRVQAAAVYNLNGKPKGLIHEIHTERRSALPGLEGFLGPEQIIGNVTPQLRAHIVQLFAVVRDFAKAQWPHQCREVNNHSFWVKLAKDDEPSSGTSADVPLAVALLSCLLQRPVPQDICCTGTLVCDSATTIVVRRVGELPYKVKGAYHRNMRAIIVPEGNRPELQLGEIVPAGLANQLVRYVNSLQQVVEAVWGVEAWDW